MVTRFIMISTAPVWKLARQQERGDVEITLTEQEYADYREMMDRWVLWQNKLSEISPL